MLLAHRVRIAALLFALLPLVCLAACAPRQNRMDLVMSKAETMNNARLFFGHPSKSEELPDGSTKHEWLLDSSYHETGKWVWVKAPGLRFDSDGYPVEVYRKVWQKPRDVNKYCRIAITADKEGRILSSSWEGHSCEDLIRYAPYAPRQEAVPEPSDPFAAATGVMVVP